MPKQGWFPELHLVNGLHFNLRGSSAEVHAMVDRLCAQHKCAGFLVYIVDEDLRAIRLFGPNGKIIVQLWGRDPIARPIPGVSHDSVAGQVLLAGLRIDPGVLYKNMQMML